MRSLFSFALGIMFVLTSFLLSPGHAEAAYKMRIGHHAQVFGSVDIVAWKKGYFDQTLGKGNYSLHQFAQGKLMAQAILSRSIDTGQVAARPYVALIGKKSKSLTAIGVMSYWCKSAAIMVRSDSKFTKLQELKGRTLITGKATSTYYGFTHFILPAYGLSEKDYRAINSVTTERIPALIAKSVDFAIVQEPASSIAEAKGVAKRLKGVDWCKYDDPPFVMGADPRSVKNQPAVITNYLRAWLRGAKLYKTNFKEFAKIFHQHLADKGRKADLNVIEKGLKVLEMHPQIDNRFYNYVDKMNKVLLKDKKTRSIADFRGGQGIMYGPMKRALSAEGWK